MSRLENMIGTLVVQGYTCSYFEDNVYLHDSQGQRWAMIEPWGMTYTVTAIKDDGTPRYCGASGIENTNQLLDQLRSYEAARA